MKNEQYFIVFFDYENDYNDEEEIIKDTIEQLWSSDYKNLSLKLSKNVLLIKVFQSDLENYPYPENIVDDALCNVSSKKDEKLHYSTLKFFVLPIDLKDIESHLHDFKPEMEYLKGRKDPNKAEYKLVEINDINPGPIRIDKLSEDLYERARIAYEMTYEVQHTSFDEFETNF